MDPVLMFKVPVIQALYGLSDAQAALQIMDRRSFGRFLSLDDGARAPDETTIRRFREALVRTGAVEKLFARFDAHLKDAGYLARISRHVWADRRCHHRGGPAPAHGRCREGDRQGRGASRLIGRPIPGNRRKRIETRVGRSSEGAGRRARTGTAMGAIATPVFGCKSHIDADRRHGFVRTWIVTDAARHDGRVPGGLPDQPNTGSTVRADTAYRSQKNEKKIARAGLTSKVHFRRPPGKPMPVHHERANAARSKVRSAIEHPFAGMKARIGALRPHPRHRPGEGQDRS